MIKNFEKPKYFVFSGGGFKGYAYISSLEYLACNNLLLPAKDMLGFAGTSIGSIFALMHTLGFTIEEIKIILDKFHTNLYSCLKIFSVLSTGAICSNVLLYDLVGQIMIADNSPIKTAKNVKDMTFVELYNLTKKELCIVTVNQTLSLTEYHSYKTDGRNEKVIDTIVASMSVPFLFPSIKLSTGYHVDGGILNNFPIEYFAIGETLGFCLCKKSELVEPYFETAAKTVQKTVIEAKKGPSFYDTLQLIMFPMTLVMRSKIKQYTSSEINEHILFIDTKDVPAIDPKMSVENKQLLYKYGLKSAEDFVIMACITKFISGPKK